MPAVAIAVVASSRGASADAVVDARLGVAWMTRSKSTALEHLFKPTLRLGGRATLGERFEVGGAFTALLDTNEHYRVLGFLAHARFAVIATRRFSLGAGLAFGLGSDADILHTELRADGTVAPYGFAALDARFSLSHHWFLSAEIAYENFALLHLGVVVGFRL